VSLLEGQLGEANGRIDKLDEGSTSINNAIVVIEGQINGTKDSIVALGNHISTVETKLGTTDGKVTIVEGKIETAQQDIRDLKTGQEGTNRTIGILQSSLDSSIGRLGDVETTASENSAKITENKQDILYVAETLFSVEARVKILENQ